MGIHLFTRFRPAVACILLPVISMHAGAEEASLCPPSSKPEFIKPLPDDTGKQTHISSDQAKVDSENETIFSGSVTARQANREIQADTVKYDRRTQEFEASGHVSLTTESQKFEGDSATINLESGQGRIDNASYFTGSVNGRGNADQIVIENKNRLRLENASYTTCPPDAETWRLNADEITLDKETRQGSASGMVLEISDIPVMYLPYVRFPIGEERMSGFLFPGVGVSSEHGTEITLPWYWNIAPSMDATITPHNMSKRGLMLETEFRYLLESGKGKINMDYLPDDKIYQANRENFTWQHNGNSSAGWSANVDYNYVSDVDYLDDFSGSLSTSSVTHLNRYGSLSYNSEAFAFTTALQDHQNISGEEPYKRLPQIKIETRPGTDSSDFDYGISSELVNFDHTDQARVIGKRFKISPYTSYDLTGNAGFLSPKLTVHHIQYELENNGIGQEAEPSVTVPVFSLDSGIYFERDTEIAGIPMLHTLEPRLFYLYAPYRDQSILPVFDTALTTFSHSILFSENRFSGNDRVGDANQLTTALSTRFYRKKDGKELFSATLGQIIYFSDREVVLPGQSIETDERSSYIGALSFNPHRNWRLHSDVQWEPETDHTEVANTRLQYTQGKGRVVNIDYRFRRNELRTRGLSIGWRVNPGWQVFGGHLYDIENEHVLEEFLGFRYDECCWAVRIVGKRLFDKLEGTEPRFEDAVFLEFELKGLSSLGSRKEIDSILENGILGYSE